MFSKTNAFLRLRFCIHYDFGLYFQTINMTTMKLKLILTSIFIIVGISIYSQNWLPEGTTWHFTNSSWGLNAGVGTLVITGDTIIQNKECSIIERNVLTCDDRPLKEYIHKENDRLYYFDHTLQRFHLLYDFSAEVGDVYNIPLWETLTVQSFNDSLTIRVDSIEVIDLPHNSLKYFHVTYGYTQSDGSIYYHTFPIGEYIEDIGCINTFFHLPESGFCDGLHTYQLRCISYPGFETHEFIDQGEFCDTLVNNENIFLENEIEIYPVPAFEAVNIKLSQVSDYQITLSTLEGKLVKNLSISSQKK